MRELHRHIHKLAASDISVYICGESGSGKELVAQVRAASVRAQGPFVALNCAAITESLQESNSSVMNGVPSQARQAATSHVEQAQGGTLFLDEVAELSLAVQAKLLRVLQEHRFVRVGGRDEVRSDFRLLSATHRRLLGEVEAGRFREDLYFRIVVFELEVPPLRERGHDILLLARHFSRNTILPVLQTQPSVWRRAMCSWPMHGPVTCAN